MKLYELRQLLNEYDQTWYARKSIYGDHERAKKLRQYLKKFATKQDTFELTPVDIFNLLQKIPEITATNSQLKLMQSIRQKLDEHYLLDIYVVLNSSGMIHENNFPTIYALSIEGRSLLHRLFCGLQSQRIRLNREILTTVLTLIAEQPHYGEVIEKSLRFLERKNHLTSTALNILTSKANELTIVATLFQELDNANCFNDDSLKHFLARESLYSVDTVITLLNRAKIALNEALIQKIGTNKHLHFLCDSLSILLNAKDFHLKTEHVTLLLKQDFTFFIGKNSVFKLLLENDLLDHQAFEHVCTQDVFSFGQILELLSEKSLLKDNQEITHKLITKELDSYRLYRAISYLKKANLLDQNTLTSCFNLMLIKPNRELFNTDVFNLFELFEKSHFYVNQEEFDILFSLSDANLRRFYGVLTGLCTSELLDHQSFTKAWQRVTEKLPPVSESIVTKKSKKETNTSRSAFLLDNKHSFFAEHSDSYESGGFGKVKKGYPFLDAGEPLYGIKKLNESDPNKAQKAAIREVKYHRLLGREAFYFFQKGKAHIVSEWQRELSLDHYHANELLQIPMEKRLRCLSSGLSDLNTLHQYYRIHGDVKCQNFILNLNKESMKLIDFGTSHKRGSTKSFGWTAVYSDPHTFGDHFCKDLYAMGLVTMYLFPEIYSVSFENGKANITTHQSEITITEQAIVNLVQAMMHSEPHLRCTSEHALNYCNELINQFNQIDDSALEALTNSSINCAHSTLEDKLRR
ncbi:protein kinase domain-containing protein [Legionella sainthelensi]|uniref:Protein kinase family protein n=1 Tax=Legionella sainthelensi TaxID=28087 RepID=A0A2H5FHM5_9GAMM|nr:protein kinase family protein [Legionella sainthelensi]AUH71045.1 protein kinase family protein [Legionella sainthelensi]